MFGPMIKIQENGLAVLLRPLRKDESKSLAFADGMSSFPINMHTNRSMGKTIEDEEEWYEKTRKAVDVCVWGIVPEGCESPIGTTSVHGFGNDVQNCSTGIIIFDKSWHGRGVGKLTHLARTWFISDILNQNTILTHVVDGNIRSQRALESVGYFVTGRELRNRFRPMWDLSDDGIDPIGDFRDTLVLSWLNPRRISILYPNGLPEEYRTYVERAQSALERARQLVQLI